MVVPCFNEVGAIRATVDGLRRALAEAGPYQLLVVDDGSDDGTSEELELLAAEPATQQLEVVAHETNRGYGAAVKTGIRRAAAEVVVITDADGTYPAEAIPALVDAMEQADMAVGARTGDRVSYPVLRRVPKLFLRSYVSWLVGRRIPDMNSGLRAFRRSLAVPYLRLLPDGFSLTTTLTVALMRAGNEVRFLPVDYAPRVGRSKIRPVRDTLGFVQLILRTGMYFAPLRVLLPLVVLLSLIFIGSLGYDVFVLRDLTDKTVLLLLFAMNTALFALLADMLDKRGHG